MQENTNYSEHLFGKIFFDGMKILNPEVNYSPNRISGGGGVFLEEMSCRPYNKKECKEQKEITTTRLEHGT